MATQHAAPWPTGSEAVTVRSEPPAASRYDETVLAPASDTTMAIGFGVFIPVFFVASGVRFDLGALTGSASALAMMPLFLLALLLVRGLPALVYRRVLDGRELIVAGLLQAT